MNTTSTTTLSADAKRYQQYAESLENKHKNKNQSQSVSSQIYTCSVSTRSTNYNRPDVYTSCAIASALTVIIGAALTPLSTTVGVSIMTTGFMAFCTSAYEYIEHESQQQKKQASLSMSF